MHEEQMQEQEELECQREENFLFLAMSDDDDVPQTRNNSTHKCSTPVDVGNHVRSNESIASSNHPDEAISQPLPSTPVPGSQESSSHRSSLNQSDQHSTTALPGSIHPSTSCDSGLSSVSLPRHLSDQSLVLSDSVSKASTCNCNCEQLASRLAQLEQKLDSLITVQPQTPNSIKRKPPLSVQKYEHIGKGTKNNRLFGKFPFPLFGGESRETVILG